MSASTSTVAAARDPVGALFALAFAYFILGTGSLAVVGLVQSMAQALAVSPAAVANLVTVFALAFAVTAPLAQVVLGRLPRRTLLLTGLTIMSIAAAVGALASSYWLLLASRVAAGAGAALVGPMASAIGAGLVPPERQGRALAIVFGGMTLAVVLAVPLSAWLGGLIGWRAVLGILAVLGFVAMGGVALRVQDRNRGVPVDLRALLGVVTQRRAGLSVATTLLQMAAQFATYALITPYLSGAGGRRIGRDGGRAAVLRRGRHRRQHPVAGASPIGSVRTGRCCMSLAVLAATFAALVLLPLSIPVAVAAARDLGRRRHAVPGAATEAAGRHRPVATQPAAGDQRLGVVPGHVPRRVSRRRRASCGGLCGIADRFARTDACWPASPSRFRGKSGNESCSNAAPCGERRRRFLGARRRPRESAALRRTVDTRRVAGRAPARGFRAAARRPRRARHAQLPAIPGTAVRRLACRTRCRAHQCETASARVRVHPRSFRREALLRERRPRRGHRGRRRARSFGIVRVDDAAYERLATGTPLRDRRLPARRRGLALLHERHDRASEGRDADPSQSADDDARLLHRRGLDRSRTIASSTRHRCRTGRVSTSCRTWRPWRSR